MVAVGVVCAVGNRMGEVHRLFVVQMDLVMLPHGGKGDTGGGLFHALVLLQAHLVGVAGYDLAIRPANVILLCVPCVCIPSDTLALWLTLFDVVVAVGVGGGPSDLGEEAKPTAAAVGTAMRLLAGPPSVDERLGACFVLLRGGC